MMLSAFDPEGQVHGQMGCDFTLGAQGQTRAVRGRFDKLMLSVMSRHFY